MTQVQVRTVQWAEGARELLGVRERVFVLEQNVPAELERDSLDPMCGHVLALDAAGEPVGTGRLTPDGRIGRMAVLAHARNLGVGRALLSALLELARAQGLPEVHLHAQEHARGFYARHGFEPEGEPFSEAGIPHIGMRMKLVSS
jgi:predicted GNAT family N-acyltransferase